MTSLVPQSPIDTGKQIINKSGGTEDVNARIHKAKVACLIMRNIWKAKQIKLNSKARIFNSNVKSLLFYGLEIW